MTPFDTLKTAVYLLFSMADEYTVKETTQTEVRPHAIYTTEETRHLLKISTSTMKRMLKHGLIKANKIGRQYRILGKEILRIVSPEIKRKAEKHYAMLKKNVIKTINKW